MNSQTSIEILTNALEFAGFNLRDADPRGGQFEGTIAWAPVMPDEDGDPVRVDARRFAECAGAPLERAGVYDIEGVRVYADDSALYFPAP